MSKVQTAIDWFARNPRFGLLGTLASVVSLPLAILPFFIGEKTRDVRYAVSPSPTTIIKQGQSSDFSVSFRDRKLYGDVSSIQIALWNNGKEAIRRDNILS